MTAEGNLVRMLQLMLLLREFEARTQQLNAAGELVGAIHLYLGQEAVAVGVCETLAETDYITSTHRGHGHVLAKGADPKRVMAELYGRVDGYCGGKGGSMHIAVPELGILGTNGIVAAGIPIAAGAALSAKLQQSGRVAASFFGEGASNEGSFHESLNLAATHRLPVLFVCENNLYAVSTPVSQTTAQPDIADRAAGYGMPGVIVDGNDAEAVFDAASRAVERARKGDGPTLIEAKTYRWRAHFEGMDDRGIRSETEISDWRARDPIELLATRLRERGEASADIATWSQEATARVDEAVAYARASGLPPVEVASQGAYS